MGVGAPLSFLVTVPGENEAALHTRLLFCFIVAAAACACRACPCGGPACCSCNGSTVEGHVAAPWCSA